MFDACPVHPKGTMVIPMLWRISEYVVCMMGVKNQNHHTHPYSESLSAPATADPVSESPHAHPSERRSSSNGA